jgi:GT2 family glycosyltransferase
MSPDPAKRHAVAMVAYNNLELTKKALASVFAQDVGPLEIWFVDNGSTDGTREWVEKKCQPPDRFHFIHHDTNCSPVKIGNELAAQIFAAGHRKILGVANDVILPPYIYRLMNACPHGIVCATETDQDPPPVVKEVSIVNENIAMAVNLLRRWAYDALIEQDGYFLDEGYFHYVSDTDLSLRMLRDGIRAAQLNLQFWHYGSATWKLALDKREQLEQADRDREYFAKKWGFHPGKLLGIAYPPPMFMMTSHSSVLSNPIRG